MTVAADDIAGASGLGADASSPVVDLRGRTIVVTGAASGIGAATVRLLRKDGARVVIADREPDGLAALADELDDVLPVTVDVTDAGQVDGLVDTTLRRWGRIDGLVNSAGVSAHQRIDEMDLAAFALALRVNVLGPATTMRAVVPPMRTRGFGRIVNVGSGTTRMAPVGTGPYASTKAALNMLSDVARRELADDGIAVSVVLPSVTATQFRGGQYRLGEEPYPGVVTHAPDYPAQAIVRALRTGDETLEVPHGPERADVFAVHVADKSRD